MQRSYYKGERSSWWVSNYVVESWHHLILVTLQRLTLLLIKILKVSSTCTTFKLSISMAVSIASMTKPHMATLVIDIVLTASCKEKPTLLGLSTSLGHSLYQLGSLPLRFSKVYKKIGSWLLEERIGISCVHLIVQVTWPSTMCRCLQFANFFIAHQQSWLLTRTLLYWSYFWPWVRPPSRALSKLAIGLKDILGQLYKPSRNMIATQPL